MTLKELRLSKHISQNEASLICDIPLRTYKRLENDKEYVNSYKYNYAYKKLEQYICSDDMCDKSYNIIIVGAGYVGYTLGVVLSKNNNVTLVDIDEDKVKEINDKGLKATLPSLDIYKDNDVDYIFICVPTNYDNDTGLLDTKRVSQIVSDIRSVDNKATIVIKSTCYIGYTSSLNDKRIVYCPEFLREKYALEDMRHPSRIIIGSDNNKDKSVITLSKILLSSTFNRPNVLYMTSKEAEAVKLFSNAYLALRLAYFNELDTFATDNNIDTHKIITGVSLDPRIGDYYNKPSKDGYGGKCLPKDTLTLANQTKGELISSIDRSNIKRKNQF